jgi:hypothetical protein
VNPLFAFGALGALGAVAYTLTQNRSPAAPSGPQTLKVGVPYRVNAELPAAANAPGGNTPSSATTAARDAAALARVTTLGGTNGRIVTFADNARYYPGVTFDIVPTAPKLLQVGERLADIGVVLAMLRLDGKGWSQ